MVVKKNVIIDFPLHTIKRVKIVDDRYRDNPDTECRLNQLLSKGWILLGISNKVTMPNCSILVFALGHTDSNADDTVQAIYEASEEFKKKRIPR